MAETTLLFSSSELSMLVLTAVLYFTAVLLVWCGHMAVS